MIETKNFTAIAKQISDAIEREIPQDSPDDLAEHIKLLATLTASAAALQANAKKMLLQKELQILQKYKGQEIQASVLMRIINAEAFEEAGWLTYAERLNAGISHSIEGLRSVLSYIKSEMSNIRQQT